LNQGGEEKKEKNENHSSHIERNVFWVYVVRADTREAFLHIGFNDKTK
jgi:hypothetical protein